MPHVDAAPHIARWTELEELYCPRYLTGKLSYLWQWHARASYLIATFGVSRDRAYCNEDFSEEESPRLTLCPQWHCECVVVSVEASFVVPLLHMSTKCQAG
jgi:hypothetical protein